MSVTQPHAFPALPYAQLQVLQRSPAAEVFSAVDVTGAPVTVIVLTPAGAADPAVRSAFAGLAEGNSFGGAAGQSALLGCDLGVARPWAANWQFPGQSGVEAWLSALPVPAPLAAAPAGPIGAQPGGFASVAASQPAPWTTGQPQAKANDRRVFLWFAGTAVVTLIVILSVVLVVVAATKPSKRTPPVARSSEPATVQSSSAAASPRSESPSPSPSAASPTPPGAGKPTLRQATAKTVAGPSYAASDRTYLMDFEGWPFAFRTPETWGCLGGTIASLPDAIARVCVDERNSEAKQKLNIMIRRCPTTCTGPERTSMNSAWFDDPAKAKPVVDDRTWFVETVDTSTGTYSVDLSRFIAVQAGQGPTWQVGVFVKSPTATKATVQKILNDIVTQTL